MMQGRLQECPDLWDWQELLWGCLEAPLIFANSTYRLSESGQVALLPAVW